MNLLTFFGKASPGKMALIVCLSAVAGMAGGLIMPCAIHVVAMLNAGRPTLLNVALLPGAALAFLLARHYAHLQGAALTELAVEEIVLEIVDGMRRLGFPAFERLDRADIFASLANTPEITTAVIKNLDVAQNLLSILTCGIYLLQRQTSAGAVLIGAVGLIVLALSLFDALSAPLVREEADTERRLFGALRHLLYGFKELTLTQDKKTDLVEGYVFPLLDDLRTLHGRILFYVSERRLLMSVCIFLVAGYAAFFAALQSEAYLETLIMILYITTPANIIYDAIPYLSAGREALRRLIKFREQLSAAGPQPFAPVSPARYFGFPPIQEIRLEQVQFTYPSQVGEPGFTVGPLSLTFKGGDITFFAGGNGSGKTTLLYLLLGLYQPDSGMIYLDGRPVNMANHQALFAPVFADCHLFDRLYGLEHIAEDRVAEVLAQLELTSVLQVRERRFSTLNLSAGQRKRLALAVAIWEDAPIYVFDEWAADQDPHFRQYFYETLLPALKARGKTVIVITHDETYFHVADHLIMLDYGQTAREEFGSDIPPEQARPVSSRSDAPRRNAMVAAPAAQHNSENRSSPPADPNGDVPGFEVSETVLAQLRCLFTDIPANIRRAALGLPGMANACEVSMVFFLYLVHNPKFAMRRHWLVTMFLLALILYMTVYRRFDRMAAAFIEDRIADLRRWLIGQVRHLSVLSMEELGAEPIDIMLTGDLKAVAAASYSVLLVCYAMLSAAITLVYLAFLSQAAALMTLTVLGGIGALYLRSLLQMRALIDELRDREQRLFAALNHLSNGFKELHLNTAKNDDFFRHGVRARAAQLRQMKARTNRLYIQYQTLAYTAWEALVVLVALGLPRLMAIPQEDLLRIVGLMLFLPFSPLLEAVPQVMIASLSVGRVLNVTSTLQTFPPETPEPAVMPKPGRFEELVYRGLTFTYRAAGQRPFTVGPIHLTLTPGEIVFITGGNGNGKSTLIKTLMGLYPLQSGEIRLNRRIIPAPAVRQMFGAVFSDYHLFDRLYGLRQVKPERVQELLQMMQLDRKVGYVDNRFSTQKLSTGQRKRLALICALLDEKPVYAFDEWAADQDPHFRAYFYQTVLPTLKAQGKTVIVVTHDERYFHAAARVIKMEYGQLVVP